MSLIRTRHTWIFLVLLFGSFAAVWTCIFVSSKLHTFDSLPKLIAFLPWALYIAGAIWLGKLYEKTWKTTEGAVRADEHGLYVDGRLTLTRRFRRFERGGRGRPAAPAPGQGRPRCRPARR